MTIFIYFLFIFLGHIRKSTIGRPDFANSADLELHATQRPKTAVGGQQKTSQTVVAQLSETQVSWHQLKFSFSEKATKIWSSLPIDLTFT
jgi:hypothetical protein